MKSVVNTSIVNGYGRLNDYVMAAGEWEHLRLNERGLGFATRLTAPRPDRMRSVLDDEASVPQPDPRHG